MASEHPAALADLLLEKVPASPEAYPQKLDLVRDAALFVRFDANSYRAASFLDDRILGPDTQGAWLPLGAVREAARHVRNSRPVHFIFHTGHVGSTLVSRLLDEIDGVLPLREPLPLRTLADAHDVLHEPESLLSEAQFDGDLALLITLWSRGYDTTRCIILKATSNAGRMAGPILARSENSKAIYLNLRAEPYLATLLAGQNSPVGLAGPRTGTHPQIAGAHQHPLAPLHAMSLGELAAMSWLAESWSQHDAVAQHSGKSSHWISTNSSPTSRCAWAESSRISICPTTRDKSSDWREVRSSRVTRRRPNTRTHRLTGPKFSIVRATRTAMKSERGWPGSSASRKPTMPPPAS